MKTRFETACHAGYVSVSLTDWTLLGGRITLPRGEWRKAPQDLAPTVRRLLPLVDEGKAAWDGDILSVPNSVASGFGSSLADAIGLPGAAPVMVDISFHGTLSKDPFIQTAWSDTYYRSIEIKRNGIHIRWGGREGRLQEPLYKLIEAIDRFNGACDKPFDERIQHWSDMSAALEQVNGEIATSDPFTKSLTVFQAGSFSLDIKDSPENLDFEPILMSRSKARSLDDNAPSMDDEDAPEGEGGASSELPDAELDRLLTSEDQKAFLKAFAIDPKVNRAYRLKKFANTYLVIDPDLTRALEIVKHARSGTLDEKREFVRNPRAAIAAEFGLEADEALPTALFVETKQWSERVTGLGLWERPDLSWLSKASTDWLPERFPVKIDGAEIEVKRAEIDDLQKEHAEAEATSSPQVIFRDGTISTQQAGDILTQVLGPGREKAEADQVAPDTTEEPSRPSGLIVAKIKTNFEGIAYEAKRRPRRAFIPTEPPKRRMGRNAFKPHQDVGFSWLVESWIAGWPGVLLADDMGLGKTFQTLAFLAWVKENQIVAKGGGQRKKRPVLIVAPTALLDNWVKESELHLAPHALGPDRADVFGNGIRKFKNTDPATSRAEPLDWRKLEEHDWVLTTYETLAENHTSFMRIEFSVAVFDEIQKIKEPGTLNTWGANAMNADFVLGLSGTPIENRIEDLWSIMDRVCPGLLGDLTVFSKTYRGGELDRYKALSDMLLTRTEQAPAIILRRMKDEVLDSLPKKIIVPEIGDMPTIQAEHYAEIVRSALAAGPGNRGAMLETVQKLRGVSLYPGDPDKFDLGAKKGCEEWVQRSARLVKTFEILRKLQRAGERALIFVDNRKMQSLLAYAISTAFDIDRPIIINGSTPGAKRREIVEGFEGRKTRFDVMILSPKAAGIGLTILSANHVIHLSRWWNPAVEDQCNDRVYRIGQKKLVTIHVPMARHPQFQHESFDIFLDALLFNKRKISKGILMPPVSDADLDGVFSSLKAA